MLQHQPIFENLKAQKAAIIWLTGLSGSGKTSISNYLSGILKDMQLSVYTLDGDTLRMGLNKDLGFSREHRKENIRRAAEVAKLFYQAGFIVICSFISPYKNDRDFVRNLVPNGRFLEVYLKCDLQECIRRDPKGLYKQALQHQLREFTGISSLYEIPDNSELIINTEAMTVKESAFLIANLLCRHKII